MKSSIKNEPVASAGIATGIVSALVTLGVLSPDREGITVAIVTLVLPILGALVARAKVTPYWKYVEAVEKVGSGAGLTPADIEAVAQAVHDRGAKTVAVETVKTVAPEVESSAVKIAVDVADGDMGQAVKDTEALASQVVTDAMPVMINGQHPAALDPENA